jgi:tRNA modification GTPase
LAFTIVAPATPPAAGGIGILRLSGPGALAIARTVAPGVSDSPSPNRVYFTDFVDAAGAALDEGLFIYFRAPRSYTGEDVVELQVHGSPRLLQMLQEQILRDPLARMAEPGEFTRRAFLNGRIDLARAEAVADLISADSAAAVRAAARQLRGALSEKVRLVREPLLALHADLEALLNFPVEAGDAGADFGDRLSAAAASTRALLAGAARGTLLRRGARVVLYGPVNAGKSTLFNCLLGEARALVDEEPGTTRDALEGRLDISGLAVTLVDTAGLRASPARLEALGIERTRAALRSADLALLILQPGCSSGEVDAWLQEAAEAPVLRVGSKSDLGTTAAGVEISVSGRTGAGLAELERAIAVRLWGEGAPQAVDLTSQRHADAVRRASDCLDRAMLALEESTLEVVSGEVGLAVEALGEITGENAPDELLDAIFRRFCIGK